MAMYTCLRYLHSTTGSEVLPFFLKVNCWSLLWEQQAWMSGSIRLWGACGRRLHRGQGILQTNLISLIPRNYGGRGVILSLNLSLLEPLDPDKDACMSKATTEQNEMERHSESSSSWRALPSGSSRLITEVIAMSELLRTSRCGSRGRDEWALYKLDYGHLRFRKCVFRHYACTYTCHLQFTMLYNDFSIDHLSLYGCGFATMVDSCAYMEDHSVWFMIQLPFMYVNCIHQPCVAWMAVYLSRQ
jgi:hypothetical protein